MSSWTVCPAPLKAPFGLAGLTERVYSPYIYVDFLVSICVGARFFGMNPPMQYLAQEALKFALELNNISLTHYQSAFCFQDPMRSNSKPTRCVVLPQRQNYMYTGSCTLS